MVMMVVMVEKKGKGEVGRGGCIPSYGCNIMKAKTIMLLLLLMMMMMMKMIMIMVMMIMRMIMMMMTMLMITEILLTTKTIS